MLLPGVFGRKLWQTLQKCPFCASHWSLWHTLAAFTCCFLYQNLILQYYIIFIDFIVALVCRVSQSSSELEASVAPWNAWIFGCSGWVSWWAKKCSLADPWRQSRIMNMDIQRRQRSNGLLSHTQITQMISFLRLYICTCMCIYIYVCMYVRTIYVNVNVYVTCICYIYEYVYVNVSVHVYVFVHVHKHICIIWFVFFNVYINKNKS